MSFSGWKEYKLEDFCMQKKESYLPNLSEDLCYIGLEHIDQQSLSLNGIGSSKKVTSTKYRFTEGDILFGKLRPYFRKVYRPNFSGVCSTDIMVFKAKENFDQAFLFYFLANQDFIDLSSAGSSGTRMPRADWNHLKDTKWQLPQVDIQYKIGNILSSLDDKIQLNRQTNQTLKAIAQALFKEWFVDFNFPGATGEMVDSELGDIPKGWRVAKLSEVLEVKYGKDHKHLESGKIPVYGSGGIMRFVNRSLYDEESILIPRKGTLSNLYYINKPFWSVDTMFYSKIKLANGGQYLYHLLLSLKLASMNVGSAVPSLTTEILNNILIIIPGEKILEEYEKVATSLFNKIEQNLETTQILTDVRDSLLPKLMKGEIII